MSRRRRAVEVRGEAELRRKLRALPPAVQDALRLPVARAARAVRDGARARAPIGGPYEGKRATQRRPGTLRASLLDELDEDRLGATIGSNLFYALFHEFGTKKMHARPFLFPAMEEHGPQFIEDVKEAARKATEGLR